MADDVDVAKRTFPARTREIERLASRDEGFSELCRDFAIAVELSRLSKASESLEHRQRREEYVVLTNELAAEIVRALDAVVVVPFRRTTKP